MHLRANFFQIDFYRIRMQIFLFILNHYLCMKSWMFLEKMGKLLMVLYIYGKWCLMMMIPLTRDVWETLACGRQSLWCYHDISLTQILICCIKSQNILYPGIFYSLWWVYILSKERSISPAHICKQKISLRTKIMIIL